jgi:hypothetical protein
VTFIEAYHVGFVVADLDATMTEFEDLLGVRWASQQHRDMPVRTRDGQIQASFRFTYSTHVSGPALIELIEGPKDTPWWPGDGVGAAFHHVGFWADDLVGDSRRLDEQGAPLEATIGAGPDARGFAYHLTQHGPRIELVDALRRPQFQNWLAGGEFPQG